MSDDKNPRPPAPVIADGSAEAIAAVNEQHRRARRAGNMSNMVVLSHAPASPPPPVFVYDASQDVAVIAAWEAHRRQTFIAPTSGGTVGPVYVREDDFPVIVSHTVIVPYERTTEGQPIKAATLPLVAIIRMILDDPPRMYEIDPRKWKEIIAAAYDESGEFDEITLTPRSGDRGRDVIAVKKGFGSVRMIGSVKRYKPGHVVTAEEVQALLGVLHGDHQASKGIVSTTWEFAPKIKENPDIIQYIPHSLELVNGADLVRRLAEYTRHKNQ